MLFRSWRTACNETAVSFKSPRNSGAIRTSIRRNNAAPDSKQHRRYYGIQRNDRWSASIIIKNIADAKSELRIEMIHETRRRLITSLRVLSFQRSRHLVMAGLHTHESAYAGHWSPVQRRTDPITASARRTHLPYGQSQRDYPHLIRAHGNTRRLWLSRSGYPG